jgi:hypothetical protein
MENKQLGKITFLVSAAALGASAAFALFSLLAPAGVYTPPPVSAGRMASTPGPCDESRIVAPDEIPEGWIWRVFPDACIGFSYPEDKTEEKFMDDDYARGRMMQIINGNFDIQNGRLLTVHSVNMTDTDDSGICYGVDMSFPFCRDEIINEWERVDVNGVSVRWPEAAHLHSNYSRPEFAAAVVVAGNRFIMFTLTDYESELSRATLEKVIGTLVIGTPRS